MKAKELRTKTDKELLKMSADLRKKLVDIHIDMRTKEVKNVKQVKLVKKDIARILTILSENELVKTEKSNE